MSKSKPFGVFVLISGATSFFGIQQIVTGNEKFYRHVLMPAIHNSVDGETAHKLAVKCAKHGFVPKNKIFDETLEVTVWGKQFKNPVGIAAGFDKHAEAMSGLSKVGFGFVEVGSITPKPQDGNPKPRVFRLIEDKCVINRYGFNSCGHQIAKERIENWRAKHQNENPILGINLGSNKLSENRVDDYVKGIEELGCFADYVVINISSPNTTGLRDLQGKNSLQLLCAEVKSAINQLPTEHKPEVLLKLAPDLTEQDVTDIVDIIKMKTSKIDGLIISNTSITRPANLTSKHKEEIGGLSGPVLTKMSTDLIRKFYKLTNGQIPIIGVGGISNGKDAYDKIKAGASLIQIYTSLVYNGFPIVTKINRELHELVKNDGYKSIQEAIGKESEME